MENLKSKTTARSKPDFQLTAVQILNEWIPENFLVFDEFFKETDLGKLSPELQKVFAIFQDLKETNVLENQVFHVLELITLVHQNPYDVSLIYTIQNTAMEIVADSNYTLDGPLKALMAHTNAHLTQHQKEIQKLYEEVTQCAGFVYSIKFFLGRCNKVFQAHYKNPGEGSNTKELQLRFNRIYTLYQMIPSLEKTIPIPKNELLPVDQMKTVIGAINQYVSVAEEMLFNSFDGRFNAATIETFHNVRKMYKMTKSK